MSDVAGLLSHPWAVALGWALVHFVWQGAAVAVAFAVARAVMRRASSSVRYAMACAALALMAALPVVSFVLASGERTTADEPAISAGAPMAVYAPAPRGVTTSTVHDARPAGAWDRSRFEAAMPWLVGVWIAGVAFLSLRLAAALLVTRQLRRAVRAVAPEWQRTCDELATRLGVHRAVRLCESTLAEVPSAIGWLRPVVLVPAGVFTGLDPRQIEAILAHELAHIRRYDYLVNLLQTAVETLLFYHPAVWWVSRQVREEREHCCDDLAVASCGDVLTYATALADLEDLRAAAPSMAMAATGGSLVRRIERLLGRAPARGSAPVCVAGALAIAVAAATLVNARATDVPAKAASLLAAVAAAASGRHEIPAPPAPPAPPRPPQSDAPEAPLAPLAPLAVEVGVEVDVQESPEPPEPPESPEPDEADDDAGEGEAAQASEYAAVGYGNLSQRKLDAFRWEGVSPDYIRSLAALGYEGLSPNELLSMRAQGVDAGFISALQALGYEHPSSEQLIAMAIHGVDAAFVRETRDLGFARLSIDALVAMRIHGVGAEYIRSMREAGYDGLSFEDLVSGRVHGVSATFVRQLAEQGITGQSFDQLVAMRIHGVTPGFLREVKALGYSPSVDDAISMRIHGVTASYIRTVVERDGRVSLDRLIDMRINGDR